MPLMIQFSCHCGFAFQLQDDQAGALVQCPTCRRLNDVPLLSDLAGIEDGGIYKLDSPVTPPQQTVQDLHRAFTRNHYDAEGLEIDLRPTMDDVRRAGSSEIPLALHDQVLPGAPKYDPFTGELIRPLDVKSDGNAHINPATIPLARQALGYATSVHGDSIGYGGVLMRLLRPSNLIVMSFILIFQFLLQGMWITMVMGFIFIFLAPVLLFLGLLGHYGNVIEEIGVNEMDELPAPLRNVSLRDDVWVPFTQVAGALMICFVPALLVERWTRMPLLALACVAIGAFFFPAVVLTTTSSGSALNLRPDRVVGVILTLGGRYAVAVTAFIVAVILYVFGQSVADRAAEILFTRGVPGLGGLTLLAGYTVLAAAIYFTHAFCYYMGILYRADHMNFPWTLQRHIPTRLAERVRPPGGHLLPPSADLHATQKLDQPARHTP